MTFWYNFAFRSEEEELMDVPDGNLEQLYNTLDQFEGINLLFSRSRSLLRQTVLRDMQPGREYHLVDLGAGACDIPVWLLAEAEKRGLRLRITAVDADPRVIAYARKKHAHLKQLEIRQADALNLSALPAFDYLFANHFLHHLRDRVLPGLLRDAARLSRRGFVFNDLKRSRFSYLAFSLLARIYRNSFARTDGLISIRKGFLPRDFQNLLEEKIFSVDTRFPGRIYLRGGCFRST
ncbi:MAG: methyltransferase domain-containing protein [Kiritimatiellia bacterium]